MRKGQIEMGKKAGVKKSAGSAKLAGKTVCFAGNLQADKAELTAVVEAAGGQVVASVSGTLDYLVRGHQSSGKVSASETKAQALIQKKNAPIQIVDEADFHQLLAPSRDEAIALLKSGPKGIEAWNRLCGSNWFLQQVDISGADFRKADLTGAFLTHANVNECDFREARLGGVEIDTIQDAQFDGATGDVSIQLARRCTFKKVVFRNSRLSAEDSNLDDADLSVPDARGGHGYVSGLLRCRAQRADLSNVHLNPADFREADLTAAKLPGVFASSTQAEGACFKKAKLTKADLDDSHFKRADFTGADLSEADLKRCDFENANLTQARLVGADLVDAKFKNADLTRADLRGAWLTDADLTGATLDGADFTGADVIGAKVTAQLIAKAKGLAPDATKPGTAGPAIKELEKLLTKTERFAGKIRLALENGDQVELALRVENRRWGSSVQGYHIHYPATGEHHHRDGKGNNVSTCLLYQGKRWRQAGVLQFDTLQVETQKCPLKPKELRARVLAAWCEALGVTAPSDEEVAQQAKAKSDEQGSMRDSLLAGLRSGTAGIAAWNDALDKLDRRKQAAILKLKGVDLSGLNLPGIALGSADLQKANLSRSNLQKAQLGEADLKDANFEKADLRKAVLYSAKLQNTNLSGAKLGKANLRCATFRGAALQRADLSNADLYQADLCGADFSAAELKNVSFTRTTFDETTRFPDGFGLPDGLVWKGSGADPRLTQKIESLKQSAEAIDFETFMQRLGENVEAAKLQKALSMLKAERFQLFAVVDGEDVTGVVKSQNDPDLVYSCRLDSGGTYACCTQNLNVCGGLRGSLCKHLLVLLIGLTKGGDLEPAAADVWVAASRLQKPALDKDRMSEIFLKYKGAEAGQIDWRPTETVPEDFYAF